METNTNLYILDSSMTTVGILSNRMPFSLPFYDDLQERDLDDFSDTLTLSVPANHEKSIHVIAGNYILYPTYLGEYKLYRIVEVSEVSDSKQYFKNIFAEISAQDDLIKDVVRPTTFTSVPLQDILAHITIGTAWTVGSIDDLGVQDVVLSDYPTKLEAIINVVKQYGGELEFEYETVGTTITKQKISVYEQLGNPTGKPFMHSKDILGVERIEDRSKIVTALIGVGKTDDKGTPLTFKDANYYENLPSGYNILGDAVGSTKALESYSRNGEHIFGVYKDDSATSPQELFENTLKALQQYERPQMTYKVTVALLERLAGYEHERVSLGDTILVQDKSVQPELYLKARVRKLSRSLTNPANDAVELGDYIAIVPPVNEKISQLQKKISEKEELWNKAEEIPAMQNAISLLPTKEDLFSTQAQRLKVRYIRDYINGSDVDATNQWSELQVFKEGKNIAKGLIPTGSKPLTNASYLTDDIVDSARAVGTDSGLQYVQLDLGEVHENVEYVKVWHNISGGRTYNQHMVDVSEDGSTWVRLYNSDRHGSHTESTSGFVVPVNSSAILENQANTVSQIVSDMEDVKEFKQSAEYELEQKVNLVDYNETVNSINKSIAEKAGLEYVDGKLQSKADNAVIDEINQAIADKADLEYVEGQLVSKANVNTTYTKTEVDSALNNKVSTLTYTTDMNGIVSKLDSHDTAIEQSEKQIALKASQDIVDKLEGRLETAEASLIVQADEIATKVTQTEVNVGVATAKSYADSKASTAETNAKSYSDNKLAPVVTRVTNAETAITQTKEAIKLKAEQSVVESIEQDVGSLVKRVASAEASIQVNKDSIDSKVSMTEVNNAINSIEIGGRNYALGTGESKSFTGKGSTNETADLYPVDFSKLAGKTLTVSFDALSTSDGGSFRLQQRESPWLGITASNIPIKKGLNHYSYTSNLSSSADAPKNLGIRMDNFTGSITISNLKLEIGSKSTDWTPAPEDVENRMLSAESAINQTAEAIEAKVSKTEVKEIARRSGNNVVKVRYIRDIIEPISANYSSIWNQISVMKGDTDLAKGKVPTGSSTATEGYPYSNITNGNTNSDGRASGSGRQWVQIDLGSVFEDVDYVKVWHYYSDERTYKHEVQVSEDSVNWISLYDSEQDGNHKETTEGFVVLVNQQKTLDSMSSSIKQTAESIESKVEKNGIVSAINQSPESIKISAKKIDITGAVTFSSFDSSTQSKINNAESTANTAKSTADTANSNANSAKSTASTANTNASNAISTANTAKSTAETAKTTADNAKKTADTANSTANSVKSTVDSNITAWNTAYDRVRGWTVSGKTTIDGGLIETNTITSQQIAIGDFTNYASWVMKGDASTSPFNSKAIPDKSNYRTAVASLRLPPNTVGVGLRNQIAVTAGEIIYYEFWIKTDSNWNGKADNSKLRFGNQSGGILHAQGYQGAKTSWTKYAGKYTVPSGVSFLQVSIGNDGSTGNVWIDDMVIMKQLKGELIVDGSITADSLHANALNGKTITGATINGSVINSVDPSNSKNTMKIQNNTLHAEGEANGLYNTFDISKGKLSGTYGTVSGSTRSQKGKWSLDDAGMILDNGSGSNKVYIGTDGITWGGGIAQTNIAGLIMTPYKDVSIFNLMGGNVNLDNVGLINLTGSGYENSGRGINMNNSEIYNINKLTFNDPGGNEGIEWKGGNGWKIFESPDNAGNGAGQMQFFNNNGRQMTVTTGGDLFMTGSSVNIQNTGTSSFTGEGSTRLYSKKGSGGEFVVGNDGNPRVWSMDIYNRTYGSGGTVVITSSGTLGRLSSATKYKLYIEEVDTDTLADRLLDIKPKSWFDRASSEAYAKYLTRLDNGEDVDINELDVPFLERHYGMIAEDLVEAGLEMYVQYGAPDENGHREVEGIEYEKVWTLLIPIVKKQKEQIASLEERLARLEERVG